MLDPRARDFMMAVSPSTPTAAIRVASNRLAALAPNWERPKATPSLPAWPQSSVGGPQPTGTGSESKRATASTNAVELNRSDLARPSLVASDPSSNATKTPEVLPTEVGLGATGAVDSHPALPTSNQAGQASPTIPSAAIPVVPGTAHGFGGLGGEFASNHVATQTTDSSTPSLVESRSGGGSDGGATSPMARGAIPIFPLATPSSDRTNINPAVGGGSPALTPSVRGRIPTAILGSIMSVLGAPNGPAMGSHDGATSGSDISGFPAMGSNSGGDGGSAMDLSKTNELLQQIVDAVRKQQGGSGTPLPASGPSVYAERI